MIFNTRGVLIILMSLGQSTRQDSFREEVCFGFPSVPPEDMVVAACGGWEHVIQALHTMVDQEPKAFLGNDLQRSAPSDLLLPSTPHLLKAPQPVRRAPPAGQQVYNLRVREDSYANSNKGMAA